MTIMLLAPSFASAQVYVVRPLGTSEISETHRNAVFGWSAARFSITLDDVRATKCSRAQQEIDGVLRNGAICSTITHETLIDAEFSAVEAGDETRVLVRLPKPADIAADGTSATVVLRYGPTFFYGADATALATVASNVWQIPAGQLQRFNVRYVELTDEDGNDVSIYRETAWRRVQVSSTERLLCIRDRTCRGLSN